MSRVSPGSPEHLRPQVEGAQLVLAHQAPGQCAAHVAQSDIAELHRLSPVIAGGRPGFAFIGGGGKVELG
jgi:hypothetical protein